MNDFQINKRVAEIAGLNVWVNESQGLLREQSPLADKPSVFDWDPLHKWHQLGPLVKRFNVEWSRGNFSGEPMAVIRDLGAFDDEPVLLGMANDPCLERAICLAIIDAHKESEG